MYNKNKRIFTFFRNFSKFFFEKKVLIKSFIIFA